MFRQQILESVLVDRMGVPTAHLHQLDPTPARQALDLGAQQRNAPRLPVFVHEAHGHATSSIREASE